MIPSRPSLPSWRLLYLLACLALSAALSVHWLQDASWDLKNYHLYNAWSFAHDRYVRDLAAAGMQTFFNPLLDLPYYFLGMGVLDAYPRALAATQGLWFGLLLFIVSAIVWRMAILQRRQPSLADAMAVVIGISGTMTVSQAGTSTNELTLACFILAGLAQLLPLYGPHPGQVRRRSALAGLSCGLAVGLKPTAMVYPPAMALALLLTLQPRSFGLKATIAYAAGTAAGFLLGYGWWGWHLYALTGNPCFPLFNQVFHSDWTGAASGTDARFRPHRLGQWLFYPFYWLRRNRAVVTEVDFADWRYGLAMAALIVLGVIHGLKAATRRSAAAASSPYGLVALFVTVSYLLWLVLFSILRYAVPIEALTGLILLGSCHKTLGHDASRTWRVGAAMAILALFIIQTTYYPNFGRTAYADQSFDVKPITVEPGSLVLFVGAPDAYLAPFFTHPESLDFVGVTWFTASTAGHRLWNLTHDRIARHRGPLYAVRRNDSDQDERIFNQLLPGHRYSGCRPVVSNLERDKRHRDLANGLQVCRVDRAVATEVPPSSH